MFVKVETPKQHKVFEQIWGKLCEEKGFRYDPYHPSVVRYLIYKGDTAVATIELIPYNPSVYTTVEKDFAFSKLDSIKRSMPNVWEIDKLGILPEYRGRFILKEILSVIATHQMEYDAEKIISMMNTELVQILSTRITLEVFGGGVERTNCILVPTLFDAKTEMRNIQTQKWYQKMLENKELVLK